MIKGSLDRRKFLKGVGAYALSGALPVTALSNSRQNSYFEDEFSHYDAMGLAHLIKTRQVSSAELVEIVIKRIEAVNPILNCVSVKTYDLARELSYSALPNGPFKGVPILMKDVSMSYKGTRTTSGSVLFKDSPPATYDDILVERMKKAGFVLTGKTTTPEFGWSISTESVLYGYTRNPWNLEHTSGGSSGGTSAAVAARILPLAWGSDGAGSIRLPASNCGLVGLKPSRGLLPYGPAYVEANLGAGTEGCLSVSVRDSAAFLDALKGSLPGDPYFVPSSRSFLRDVYRDPGCLKIGITTQALTGLDTDPECVEAVRKTALLLESLGHNVEEMSIDIDYEQMKNDYFTSLFTGSAPVYDIARQLLGREPDTRDFSPVLLELLQRGLEFSGTDLNAAILGFRQHGRNIAGQCNKYDVVLTPTLPEKPAKLGYYDTVSLTLDEFHDRFFHGNSFAVPFNVSGQPGMSLPLHWSQDGLPIGVQIVAQWSKESTLFRLAGQLEQAMPWRNKLPPIIAG